MELVGFHLPEDRKGGAIAYEFMENGSLLDVLTRVRSGDIPVFWTPTGIATIVMGLVLGMKFMHSQKAIHRNLKPSNLFISDDGHLRIGDLTWCRFSNSKCQLTKQPGSAHYSAPDIYVLDNYDEKVDVFSFGLVLYEVLAGKPVFERTLRPQRVMGMLVSGNFAEIPNEWPPPVRQLLSQCWRMEPARRPSFDEIASYMAEMQFQLLSGVESDAVYTFVEDIGSLP
jgi:serine/threonine protein kinase